MEEKVRAVRYVTPLCVVERLRTDGTLKHFDTCFYQYFAPGGAYLVEYSNLNQLLFHQKMWGHGSSERETLASLFFKSSQPEDYSRLLVFLGVHECFAV